jgi:hypothetical protein
MSDNSTQKDFSPEVLRARVNAWVEHGGGNELKQAVETARQTREAVRDALRIDQQSLNHPVTL